MQYEKWEYNVPFCYYTYMYVWECSCSFHDSQLCILYIEPCEHITIYISNRPNAGMQFGCVCLTINPKSLNLLDS